mgnify:CR=1 FL=1
MRERERERERKREREREREYDIQMIGVDKYMILLAHAWIQSVERRQKYYRM